MFWKKGENKEKYFLSSFPASKSITFRLTICYILSAFGILSTITCFLYFALQNNLNTDDNQFLIDKINDLRAILKSDPNDLKALQDEVNQGKDFPFVNYARIFDEKGRAIVEFTDTNNNPPASLFPDPIQADENPKEGQIKTTPNGTTYLLISAWAQAGSSQDDKRLIQAALNISREVEIIQDYKAKVLIMLVVGILLSAVTGFIISRRGMRPIQDITKVVNKIRSTKLNERLNPSKWPMELTELAASFDEMLANLDDSFKRLSQFSSNLAHELRTPINNIMGEAQVTLSRPRSNTEYRQHIELNLEEFDKLSHIIESLLFLAKAESSDIKLDCALFNVAAEIKTILDYYEALIEQRRLTVSCHGSASLHADPVLFRRVISNLLSNAIKYSNSGGKVDILIKETFDNFVTVCVSDAGIGISMDDISRIFDRFYRSSGAKKVDPKGAGLGLAIVKSIMNIHRGTVTIKSDLAKGTSVCLTFPANY
jgi:two-component system heavy metal sensor histidine kinase CusS